MDQVHVNVDYIILSFSISFGPKECLCMCMYMCVCIYIYIIQSLKKNFSKKKITITMKNVEFVP